MTVTRFSLFRPGFTVDLGSCTGCKACQLACQDVHGLAPEVRWRRVVEVAGGGWVRDGALWRDEGHAYYVSVACMHCERPICAEVCPSGAMAAGDDGIVAVDAERCVGCKACAMACPYGAPQFDETAGVMTKCDLCRDRLATGRPPACVAACPMRVLGVEDAPEGSNEVFPLPPAALTEPRTALAPHRDVDRAAAAAPRIANAEEI